MVGSSLLLFGGCGDGDDAPSAGAPVEFRTVITSSQLNGGCRADPATCEAWGAFRCPGAAQQLGDDLLMACGTGDESDQPYLLAAAQIVGGVEGAEATHRAGTAQWEVWLDLDDEATRRFAALTAELVPHSDPLAIVLDQTVLSAPAVQTKVTDGVVRLAGDYTEAEAETLADELAPQRLLERF